VPLLTKESTLEQLLTEKVILCLQNVQIVCILFILLNGKCAFINGLEKIAHWIYCSLCTFFLV